MNVANRITHSYTFNLEDMQNIALGLKINFTENDSLLTGMHPETQLIGVKSDWTNKRFLHHHRLKRR